MSFLYVQVYYGPCYTFQNHIHKPQLLAGFRGQLQKLGYRVDLLPVDFANYCMVEMCGHEIFRCNIKQLKFNTRFENDRICQRMIEAVMSSSLKFRRARAYLWFWTLFEHEMFRRSKYAPTDFWPPKTKEEPLSCTTCSDCCNMDPIQRLELERKKIELEKGTCPLSFA